MVNILIFLFLFFNVINNGYKVGDYADDFYLENVEHVGKVLSFSSVLKVAEKLNNNNPLGSLEMGVLYTKLPDNIKKEIVNPYISIENSEARISLRIKDSDENLRRNDLINKIKIDQIIAEEEI